MKGNHMSEPNNPGWNTAKNIAGVTVATGAVVTCLAFAVVAVRGEDSETAKADFCDSASAFATTVQDHRGLDPRTATNDEIDSAYDDVESAWDEMVDDASDWANAYDNELASAYWDLYYAVEELPGDNTMSENVDQLEPELSAFPDAFADTFDGTGCTTA
jgi:hypothetical protein